MWTHFGRLSVCLFLMSGFVLGCSSSDETTDKGTKSGDSATTTDNGGPENGKTADSTAATNAGEESVDTLIEQLKSDNKEVQAAAATSLAEMGANAAPALDALVEALKDDDVVVRAAAVRAIGMMGEPGKKAAIPMVKMIRDDDPFVRRETIEAIRNLDFSDEQTVPLMIAALGEADQTVVLQAASTLAQFGETAVPAMIRALENEQTAFWACLVLNQLGPEAKPAVPKLTELLDHPHEELRHEAAQTLGAIGAEAASAAPALAETAGDAEEFNPVRAAACYALAQIGPPAKAEALESLQEISQGEDAFLKVLSLWAIEKVDPNEDRLKNETAQKLVQQMTSEDTAVGSAAARALLDLRPGPEVVAPLIAEVMDKTSPEVAALMMDAAASLGAPVVPRMVVGLEFEPIRMAAIGVLGRIGAAAAEAVPALIKYAKDENPEVRGEVFFVLGQIGAGAKDAVPAATEALADEEESVRFSAVYALGKIGPDASSAVDTLKEHIADESNDKYFRAACAWALVQIDPSEENVDHAVPLLIDGLDSEEAFVRYEMAQVLGQLGAAAEDAVGPLQDLTDDPDQDVREAATEAIKKISGE